MPAPSDPTRAGLWCTALALGGLLPWTAYAADVSPSSTELVGTPAGVEHDRRPVEGAPHPAERRPYLHLMSSLSLGRGLRFNNPYRLETPLGDDAESLSLTATYLDLGAGVAFGDPNGFQHGPVAHLSLALDGIPQEVLSLSYQGLLRQKGGLLVLGRAGLPVILEPDLNLGLELAAGVAWLFRAGLGLTAELIGSWFNGAATLDESVTFVPVLSLQLGVWVDYEFLP